MISYEFISEVFAAEAEELLAECKKNGWCESDLLTKVNAFDLFYEDFINLDLRLCDVFSDEFCFYSDGVHFWVISEQLNAIDIVGQYEEVDFDRDLPELLSRMEMDGLIKIEWAYNDEEDEEDRWNDFFEEDNEDTKIWREGYMSDLDF